MLMDFDEIFKKCQQWHKEQYYGDSYHFLDTEIFKRIFTIWIQELFYLQNNSKSWRDFDEIFKVSNNDTRED